MRNIFRSALWGGALAVSVAACGTGDPNYGSAYRASGSLTAPTLYSNPQYESPVHGDPGDLLLLPGNGFQPGAVVVYAAVSDITQPLTPPAALPACCTAAQGSLVPMSTDGNSVAVRLPMALTASQIYALWVGNPDSGSASGYDFSNGILINDPRPMWLSPSAQLPSGQPNPFIYMTATRPGLTRQVSLVGRNLDPAVPPHWYLPYATVVRFTSPSGAIFTLNASIDGGTTSAATQRYVATVNLPAPLPVPDTPPFSLKVEVARDGANFVLAPALQVRPDPTPSQQFTVGTNYADGSTPCTGLGTAGEDDTLCITRAIQDAARNGGGDVVFPTGSVWNVANCQPNGRDPVTNLSALVDTFTFAGSGSATTYAACFVGSGIPVPQGVNLVAQASVAASEGGAGQPTIVTQQGFAQPYLNQYPGPNDPYLMQRLFMLYGNSQSQNSAAFPFLGNVVRGLHFKDVSSATYTNWYNPPANPPDPGSAQWGPVAHSAVDVFFVIGSNVTITGNSFDNNHHAIAMYSANALADTPPGGTGFANMVLTNNFIGTFMTNLDLTVLEDGVLSGNTIVPGATIDPIGFGLGGSHRLELSGNQLVGTDQTYSKGFLGFRSAAFFPVDMAHEQLLVANNRISCSGTRPYNDGDTITVDSNGDQMAFTSAQTVQLASQGVACTVAGQTQACSQVAVAATSDLLPIYLPGRYVQVVYGQGLGQTRKIVAADTSGSSLTFNVWPPFDVLPSTQAAAPSRILIGNQAWQSYFVGNTIDNSGPKCQGAIPNTTNLHLSNTGMITYFGPAADSVIDGNLQIQTTGLSLSAQYDPWYVNGAGVRQPQSIQFFTEVRDNVISGSFRENTQMGSTITLFSFIDQATGWPPVIASTPDQITMAFGVNVAHNDLDETSSRSVDVNGTPSSIFISNIGQATGPTPGYVDTLVFGNNIVSSDPRASGIMNGDLPQYDANTPLRTMFCANTVANATPYSDPNNSAIYCPPTP